MPFPRRLLNDGEDVILDLHPHWWFFAGPAAALVGALVLAVAVGASVSVAAVTWALVLGILVAAVWMAGRYARWATTNFVVTTDRLVYRAGVLAKHGREIPLDRINDLSCSQSLWERVVGAGDLLIESGGERGQQVFTDIPRPFVVQNVIYQEVERSQQRTATIHAGAGRELSIPEQIEKLDELRQRGIITPAEFESKKTQLLDRM